MTAIPPITVTALLALVVAALGFVGIMLMRMQRRPGEAEARAQSLAAERDRLAGELEQARARAREDGEQLGALRASAAVHAQLSDEHAALRTRFDALRGELESERIARGATAAELADRGVQLEVSRNRMQTLEAELSRLHAEHAQASAHLVHAEKARGQMQQFVDEAQARLSDAFAQLAGKAFEERGAVFEKNIRHATVQSKADIETLLKPFAEQLGVFRQRVDTLYGEEAKERAALLGAVTELKALNQDMAGHTLALTRALKGNAKVRGDWGELMLENVLRGSGLEEGKHYDRQREALDDDGAKLRPDIVVRLPDDRRIVIDSKVNLVAWQDAMNTLDSPDEHNDAMRRHALGLRQHVRDLGEKNYPKAIGESALEITIAFVPIEGALSAALGFDQSLQTDAFDRKIVFASPNTIMALLRVVERLWTRDKIQRKAVEISDLGGLMLDSLMNFISDFDNVGKELEQAQKAFGAARGKLSESSQAVIPRARRLAEMGVRTRKALSEELKSESTSLLGLTPTLPVD
jgi:DNA recombination protein RmuC